MISGGIKKIYLLERKHLVRRGRTLARSFVPPEEGGVQTVSEKLLTRADRWLVSKARAKDGLGRLIQAGSPRILLSDKVDPQLKLEIAKAGLVAKAEGAWRRITGFLFGSGEVKAGKALSGGAGVVERAIGVAVTPESKLERFLVGLYGPAANVRRDNANRAIDAFRTMVSTVGRNGGTQADLDSLVLAALTKPGQVPLPPGYRTGFVSRQVAELRVSIMLGESGSAGSLLRIKRGLGLGQDIDSLREIMANAKSGGELIAALGRAIKQPPNPEQKALLAQLGEKLDRLFGVAGGSL